MHSQSRVEGGNAILVLWNVSWKKKRQIEGKGKKDRQVGWEGSKNRKRDKKERRENVSESTQTQDFNSPL